MHFTVTFIICSLHMSSTQNQCFKIIKRKTAICFKENHGVKDLKFIQFCGYAAVWGDTGRLWKLMRCLPETLSVPQGGPGQSSLPEVLEDMKKLFILISVYLCVHGCESPCAYTESDQWWDERKISHLHCWPKHHSSLKKGINKDKNTLTHFIIINK